MSPFGRAIGRGGRGDIKLRPLDGGKNVIVEGTSGVNFTRGDRFEFEYKNVTRDNAPFDFGVLVASPGSGISIPTQTNQRIHLALHDSYFHELLVLGECLDPAGIAAQTGGSNPRKGSDLCKREFVYLMSVEDGKVQNLELGDGKLIEGYFPDSEHVFAPGSILGYARAVSTNPARFELEEFIRGKL